MKMAMFKLEIGFSEYNRAAYIFILNFSVYKNSEKEMSFYKDKKKVSWPTVIMDIK